VKVEQLVGAAIAMKPDLSPTGGHVQGELRAVIIDLPGRNDGRICRVALADPSERIPDEPAPALELRLLVDMLELTPSAFVLHKVGAARLDPVRGALEHATQAGPGEALVLSEAGQLD
jgi:hypothetical protein